MLYISREFPNYTYAVIDTDDGKESIVSYKELNKCVQLGIEIKGVEVRRSFGNLDVSNVSVYHDANSTVPQLKGRLLTGVDVKLVNGMINGIEWTSNEVKSGTRVVLSQYATVCADAIEFKKWGTNHIAHIVLVLDDKIKIGSKALYMAYRCSGVKVDITRVSNPVLVRMAYRTLRKVSCGPAKRKMKNTSMSEYDKYIAELDVKRAREFVEKFDATDWPLIDLPERALKWRKKFESELSSN